jgi:hypothetical protein
MTHLPLSPDELAFLLEVDGGSAGSPEAVAVRELGDQLRAAAGGGADVADDVMLALGLNAAVAGGVDVADDVMLALGLNAAVAGGVDVADDVMLALGLNSAVAGGVDVADDVMLALGLNEAVGGGVDVAESVMAALRPAEQGMPRWASIGGMGALFAMAAAALFSIQAGSVGMAPPIELHAEAPAPMLMLASFNDAEVEDIVALDSASVSVMQFGEGGPTIIFVQDSEG